MPQHLRCSSQDRGRLESTGTEGFWSPTDACPLSQSLFTGGISWVCRTGNCPPICPARTLWLTRGAHSTHALTLPRMARPPSSSATWPCSSVSMRDRAACTCASAFVLGHLTALDWLMEIASMGQKTHWESLRGAQACHMTKRCVHSLRQTGQDQGPHLSPGQGGKRPVQQAPLLPSAPGHT